MADLYKLFPKAALTGESDVDLLSGDVKIIFIDEDDYTVDLSTDEFLSDIPAGARVAISPSLTSKTFTALAFDAADVSLGSVTGDEFEAIVGFIDTGDEATSRLVWYDDSITPQTPNGTTITVAFNAGGIFSLPAGNLFAQTLKAAMTGTSINILSSDIKLVFVDAADHTADLTNDAFLDDIPGGARVATSGNLGSKTFTALAFDAADLVVSGVTGDEFEEVIGFIDSGNEATSRLLWRMTTGSGLPFTPNGGNVDFIPNASGIFSL